MTAPAAIVETHVSVVTMIGDRAYKLLKPVDLTFLDHRRREDREAACHRETEVNRRFAPDVYLGVLDVLGPDGALLDHLIAMRRMPAERRLSRLLDGPEARARVAEVARVIARLHDEAPRGDEISRAGTAGFVAGLWEEGLAQLAARAHGVLDDAAIDEAARLARRYIEGRGPLFAERIAAGWVRDGHGDLLCDDVFCLDDGPRILDCLAFDDRLRFGDILLDVAFLTMDLEARGHPELAERLLERWAHANGEAHPVSLAHHYVAYRAHVRAKVAVVRAAQGDEGAVADARRLHALCLSRLQRGRVRLVLVGGAPGTGKSTVAGVIGDALGWWVLGSDEIRRQEEGPPSDAEANGFEEGRYAPDRTGRVYATMCARAGELLARGESVVLDATWADAGRRAAARAVAQEHRADLVEIRCEAPTTVAEERIVVRRAAGRGVSDATPVVARRMAEAFAPWHEASSLSTDRDRGEVARAALALTGPA